MDVLHPSHVAVNHVPLAILIESYTYLDFVSTSLLEICKLDVVDVFTVQYLLGWAQVPQSLSQLLEFVLGHAKVF